jgi:ATP synthase protein I
MDKKIGHYSFIIGVILALVLGLASPYLGDANIWLSSLLVVLGLIVGFLNVTGKETREFLLVSAVLIITAFAGNASAMLGEVNIIGSYISSIFSQFLAFIVPATIIVGLKDILKLSQA